MHAVIANENATEGIYAIFVWDTRKVIEQGKFKHAGAKALLNALQTMTIARDNSKQLYGLQFDEMHNAWLQREATVGKTIDKLFKNGKGTDKVTMIDKS